MSFGGDWSSWFTGILMALTVTVGLLGIFQDRHRKDGKLTWVGWGLVAAIVLLGGVTFLSSLRDQRIADEKEQADSAERGRQFQSQMGALREVTGSLSQVRTDLRDSLQSQRQLFGVADRNLQMSAGLQQQSQANTLNVLRRVFEESNRITPERVAVSIDFHCPLTAHPYPPYPTVNAVQVAIEGRSGTELSLVSRVNTRLNDEIIFHGFLADLGRYETFPAWRNARIRIRVTGRPPFGTPPELREEIRAADEELRRRGIEYVPMRCPMLVMLFLNGRQMLSEFGYFERTSPTFFLLEFEDLRVDPQRLPRF